MTIVGFIEAGENGSPFPNLGEQVGPVLREVLSLITQRDYCVLSGQVQSGLQELGLEPAAFAAGVVRSFLQCPNNPVPVPTEDCPTSPNVTAGICFQGGQCEFIFYRVTVTIDDPQEPAPTVREATVQGPITAIGSAPGSGGTLRWIVDTRDTGFQTFATRSSESSMQIDSIVRLDGQPDDCGDLPTGIIFPPNPNLPPPPAPGDIIQNQTFETINVINNTTTGDTTELTIPVGPIIFSPDFGLEIPVPGFPPIRISPSGEINIPLEPEFEFGPELDGIAIEVENNGDGIQGIQDEIDQSFTATINIPACEGDPVVLEATGEGFGGLAELVALGVNGLAAQSTQYCELLPPSGESVPEAQLQSYMVGNDTEPGIPLLLASDIISVRVSASVNANFSRIFSGNTLGDPSGRFGYVTFGVDYGSGILWEPVEEQWYKEGVYSVPRFPEGDTYMRVRSFGGVTLTIFDTGFRE